jgi:hypothetical protein
MNNSHCLMNTLHDRKLNVLAWFVVRPWRRRRCVPSKRRLGFNVLQGVVSQKIVFYIFTDVMTPEPTLKHRVLPKRQWSSPTSNFAYAIFFADCLGHSPTLKMEAIVSTETSVNTCLAIWSNVPETSNTSAHEPCISSDYRWSRISISKGGGTVSDLLFPDFFSSPFLNSFRECSEGE